MKTIKDDYINYLFKRLSDWNIHAMDYKTYADKNCTHIRRTFETKGGAHYYCPDCEKIEVV